MTNPPQDHRSALFDSVARDRSFRAVAGLVSIVWRPRDPTVRPVAGSDRSVHASSTSGCPNVDGEWHEFNQICIRNRIRIRDRQGLAFLQEDLSEILHGACDHQPCIG
jgi:hypothetical protein